MIFYSMSLHSFQKLFTEICLNWLIFESVKTLEINTYFSFNLMFANTAILSGFFLFLTCTY